MKNVFWGRVGFWGGSGLGVFQEKEVATVEDGEEEVAEDDGEFVEVQGVNEGDEAAPEAEVPKEGGHDDFSFFFGAEPLNNEAEAENGIADEAESGPPV